MNKLVKLSLAAMASGLILTGCGNSKGLDEKRKIIL